MNCSLMYRAYSSPVGLCPSSMSGVTMRQGLIHHVSSISGCAMATGEKRSSPASSLRKDRRILHLLRDIWSRSATIPVRYQTRPSLPSPVFTYREASYSAEAQTPADASQLLIALAGTPPTIVRGGTSRVTT